MRVLRKVEAFSSSVKPSALHIYREAVYLLVLELTRGAVKLRAKTGAHQSAVGDHTWSSHAQFGVLGPILDSRAAGSWWPRSC